MVHYSIEINKRILGIALVFFNSILERIEMSW